MQKFAIRNFASMSVTTGTEAQLIEVPTFIEFNPKGGKRIQISWS
ncbi:MAG: hypothetical protein QOH96_3181 [Blastocatellia bacterium]|nr:hypothetical protein [Blastocatellia bacterium]